MQPKRVKKVVTPTWKVIDGSEGEGSGGDRAATVRPRTAYAMVGIARRTSHSSSETLAGGSACVGAAAAGGLLHTAQTR